MNNKIKNVLLKLENAGFKAYVVGGFVRDYLLGNPSFDVDISTDAYPTDVRKIFNLSEVSDENYGRIYYKDYKYNYDITTFRSEEKYENRKPIKYDYIKEISEDIKRRDFTINSLYMDKDGNIYDELDGKKDLLERRIKVIGNIDEKLSEDPLRILRAIRFASLLDFKLDEKLYNYIKLNKDLIKTLSNTRKKEELDKIFSSNNKLIGIKLIKELDLSDALDINLEKEIIYTDSPLGIWAQIDPVNYPFKRSDLKTIDDIKRIVKYGIIDNIILYECGLFPATIAGDILKENTANISSLYTTLPIYSRKDIEITGDEIIEILNIKPSKKIENIISDIEINILNNLLVNNHDDLVKYIKDNWS